MLLVRFEARHEDDNPSVLCCCWLGNRKGIQPVKLLTAAAAAILVTKVGNLHLKILVPNSLYNLGIRMHY